MTKELELLKNDVSKLPGIYEDVNTLKNNINSLNETTKSLETKLSDINQTLKIPQSIHQPTTTPDQNEIWQELQERQNRSNNVVLFNVPEKGDDGNDIATIMGILTNNPPTITRFSRVGKPNSKGARALKITLNSYNEAVALVRNRSKLKGKNIFVNLDLTRKQQEFDKQVWTEFKDRVNMGENIQVKYTRGVPHIVSVQEN